MVSKGPLVRKQPRKRTRNGRWRKKRSDAGKKRKMTILKEMPNPTKDQLNDPMFQAIWQTIKSWDVNVPEYYEGYCGATGSHVMLILNALKDKGLIVARFQAAQTNNR